jgi:putative methionine-R-sulfoxide reductase with GAF domain
MVSDKIEQKHSKEIRIKKGYGLAGVVWETGESHIVNNIQKDDKNKKFIDDKSNLKIRSVIAVPLKVNGKIIGIIEAINKNTNRKL